MRCLSTICRALQYAMALGSIVTLLASCGSEVDPKAKESSSEESVATAHQALLGPDGATYTPVVDPSSLVENCTALSVWSKGFGDVSGQSAKATAIDNSNNVVIAGDNLGTVDFGGVPLTTAGSSDVFIAKFNSAGNHLWSKQFGDASSQNTLAAKVDSAGNVVVTGLLDGTANFGGGPLTTAGLLDVFLAKFDTDGNHLWSKRFGDSTTQNAGSVAIDNAGNVVIVGSFQGSMDFGGGSLVSAGITDIFVAKFDASGNHLWSKRFGNSSVQNANAVAVDGSGNVIFTGLFQGAMSFGGATLTSAGGNDIYLAKLDASGNHLWSKSFGTTGNEVTRGIAADSVGNVVITGLVTTAIDFGGGILTVGGGNDGFVAKFDASGNHVWSRAFGDAGSQIFISAATDSLNNVIIGGQFAGTIDMGGGTFTSAGAVDAFVAKFNPNGVHIWSQSFGSTANDVPQALAIDNADNVVLAGDFSAAIDLGNGPIVNAGATDAFVVKLVPCVPIPLGGSCTSNGNCVSQYCDPAGNVCACDQNADCTGTEVCNTVANPNVCTTCGNGMVELGEVCDDSNFNNGDGCSSNCLHELGGTCGSDAECVNNTCTDGVCCQAFFCNAQDQCHNAGTCQAGTGICSNPSKADGTSCNDNNACTQSDTCLSGTCTGANPITCSASDQCHDVGTCDLMTGICSNPTKADGASCNDNNACTQSDTCLSGT
ncbi:MAG TPA: hypothetical protein PK156_16990, partial [Polyangium sp.]|nr:hypothetical protein [Polyangium sp.]